MVMHEEAALSHSTISKSKTYTQTDEVNEEMVTFSQSKTSNNDMIFIFCFKHILVHQTVNNCYHFSPVC